MKQYVGETYREFNVRMKEHLRYIRNPHQYDESTGRHFNIAGHKINDFHVSSYTKWATPPRDMTKNE